MMTLQSRCERRVVWVVDTYELPMRLFLLEQPHLWCSFSILFFLFNSQKPIRGWSNNEPCVAGKHSPIGWVWVILFHANNPRSDIRQIGVELSLEIISGSYNIQAQFRSGLFIFSYSHILDFETSFSQFEFLQRRQNHYRITESNQFEFYIIPPSSQERR